MKHDPYPHVVSNRKLPTPEEAAAIRRFCQRTGMDAASRPASSRVTPANIATRLKPKPKPPQTRVEAAMEALQCAAEEPKIVPFPAPAPTTDPPSTPWTKASAAFLKECAKAGFDPYTAEPPPPTADLPTPPSTPTVLP